MKVMQNNCFIGFNG